METLRISDQDGDRLDGVGREALGIAISSRTTTVGSRRQTAPNLSVFELPPPKLQFSPLSTQRIPPLVGVNASRPPISGLGQLLTPSDLASEKSASFPIQTTPNSVGVPVLPYTPTFFSTGTTPHGYHTGYTPPTWQIGNLPPRSMFSTISSPTLRHPTNPSPAGEGSTLPAHSQSQPAFMRPPPPSYSLPAMPGPVMSNINSPGAQMSMVGNLTNSILPTSFTSGYVPNPQTMYFQPSGNVLDHPPVHDRPFKCDQCPQSFNRNHDLKRHKRIHLAVKPFPCKHCDKSFSRKDALKRHILVKGCGSKSSVVEDDIAVSYEPKSPRGLAHSHQDRKQPYPEDLRVSLTPASPPLKENPSTQTKVLDHEISDAETSKLRSTDPLLCRDASAVSICQSESPEGLLSNQMQNSLHMRSENEMSGHIQASPLDKSYSSTMAPIEARMRECATSGWLLAESRNQSGSLKRQNVLGREHATETVKPPSPTQAILHPGFHFGKMQIRAENDQSHGDESIVQKNHSRGSRLTPERITPARLVTILTVAAASLGSGSVILDSSSTVVFAQDADVIILDKIRNLKYVVSTTTALIAAFRALGCLCQGKTQLSLRNQDLQIIISASSSYEIQQSAFFKLVFGKLSLRPLTPSFVQSIAPSPWLDLNFIVAGNNSRGSKRRSEFSSSDPPLKKTKTATGSSAHQISVSRVSNRQSGPLVARGLLNKFRLDGKKGFGCYFYKFDPATHHATCSHIGVRDLRTLRRSDRHMKLHIDQGNITREELDVLFSETPEAAEAPDDEERMINSWRLAYVRLFPVYLSVVNVIDPYAGTSLFSSDIDPDGKIAVRLKLRQSHVVASSEQEIHELEPASWIADNSFEQNESVQQSAAECSQIGVPPPIPSHSSIQIAFQTVGKQLNTILNGLRSAGVACGTENISQRLETLEWLHTNVCTTDALRKVVVKSEAYASPVISRVSRLDSKDCPIQQVFDLLHDEWNDALEGIKALEDESLQASQEFLTESLITLDRFNACLTTPASLHKMVQHFATRLRSERSVQESSSSPQLTHGTTPDGTSSKSHSPESGIDPLLSGFLPQFQIGVNTDLALPDFGHQLDEDLQMHMNGGKLLQEYPAFGDHHDIFSELDPFTYGPS